MTLHQLLEAYRRQHDAPSLVTNLPDTPLADGVSLDEALAGSAVIIADPRTDELFAIDPLRPVPPPEAFEE